MGKGSSGGGTTDGRNGRWESAGPRGSGEVMVNARGSHAAEPARLTSINCLFSNGLFSGKVCLKNRAVSSRVQPLVRRVLRGLDHEAV